jgi:Tol biopolymer transport system component/DNA-binding winged helix-turn-helix (wHTH) protein
MLSQPPTFRFGDVVLDCAQRRLLRAKQDIYLPPKTFALLVYLIQNQGRVVPKRELLDAVWPDVNVVENTLAQRIREIREALGDAPNGTAFVKTIPRVGYQFTGQLEQSPPNGAQPLEHVLEPRQKSILGWHVSRFGALALAVLVAATALLREGGPPTLLDHRLVSDAEGSARFPSLSPDGSTVAFVDDLDGRPQVWVRNVTGGRATQLTFVAGMDIGWTRWSPASDRIYFNCDGGIWFVPAIGGAPRRVVARGKNPSLSLNGAALVYEGLGTGDGDRGIWLATADGANPKRVLSRPYDIAAMPAVSPDGRSIVFFRSSGGPLGDLWIVPTAKATPRRLTFDDAEVGSPTWTPDGRFVIFPSKRAGSRTLWRIPVAGGEAKPITTGTGEDIDPQVSIDGRDMIYTNVRNTFRLEVLDAATGRRAVVAERRMLISAPRFSPEGDQIAFFQETDAGIHLFRSSVDGQEIRQVTKAKGERNLLPRWSAAGDALFFAQVLPKPSFRRVAADGGESTEVGQWPWDAWVEFNPQQQAIVYQRANATFVRWLGSGQERKLTRTIGRPRWSSDGQAIFGTEVVQLSDRIAVNVVECHSEAGTCRIVTTGHAPVPSPDGRTLYFMRNAKLGLQALWVIDLQRGNERYVGEIGPFRLPDVFFDVSPRHVIAWPAFHEGKPETWITELR